MSSQQYFPQTDSARGVLAGIGAFLIWGLMPIFWKALGHVPALEVLCVRVICSFLVIFLLLLLSGRLGPALLIVKTPRNAGILFICSTLLGGNWLLYIWAIQEGYVLETSLGYYINPLLNVFLGFLLLSERPSRLAWVAIAFATAGVMYQVVGLGQVPFIALGLSISFGIYGYLRKVLVVESLPALLIETMLHTPTAIICLLWLEFHGGVHFHKGDLAHWATLLATGPVTTLPLLWFAYAAHRMQLTTLGLLQYLSPSLVFFQGVVLFHEPMSVDRVITFACIWIALALYSVDVVRTHRQKIVYGRTGRCRAAKPGAIRKEAPARRVR